MMTFAKLKRKLTFTQDCQVGKFCFTCEPTVKPVVTKLTHTISTTSYNLDVTRAKTLHTALKYVKACTISHLLSHVMNVMYVKLKPLILYVNMYCAQTAVPVFTKGKKQLTGIEVE